METNVDSVKCYQDAKVTRGLLAEAACASFDAMSNSKLLASRLAALFDEELRFLPQPGLWVYRDPVLERWREAKGEPLKAAKQICEEASSSLGRGWQINTDAVARNVLRLAELEPRLRRPVEYEPAKWGRQ